MEPPGIQKRLSLNFFDPGLATKTPPKPVKPKIKEKTSLLEIAQRNASAEDYNASVFDGMETKRRLSTRKRSKSPGSKSVEFAVYRLNAPDLASKVSKDTDIDLSYSDLGYLAQIYKNSVSRNETCYTTDDVDSPSTTNEKFRRYVGTAGGSYSDALYDSVNYDLVNNGNKRKQSIHNQVGNRKKSLADKPRSSSMHSNLTSHTPNLIVMKKSPERKSVSSRKGVTKVQKIDYYRKVSKAELDIRDPLPEPPKNSVQYMATPPSPNFVIAKRKKSAPSARSSVRFSVVQDAKELAEQMNKSKESNRRKSHHEGERKRRESYTEADYVRSSAERDKDIEALREQLKRTLTTDPASQTTSPDSDYVSHSSNRQSGNTSSSSSSSASSSSSGDSGSSSSSDSESYSSSGSSSGSSGSSSSSRSRSRSSSASSSDSELRERKTKPDKKGDKYTVKGKKAAKYYESDEEVQDGKVLLGDVSHRVEKKSIICVIL